MLHFQNFFTTFRNITLDLLTCFSSSVLLLYKETINRLRFFFKSRSCSFRNIGRVCVRAHTHIMLPLCLNSVSNNGHVTYSQLPWFFSLLNLVCKSPCFIIWKNWFNSKKCLGNARLHWVFNMDCDSLRSWYTIFSISQINLTWGALLKSSFPITSDLVTDAGKF